MIETLVMFIILSIQIAKILKRVVTCVPYNTVSHICRFSLTVLPTDQPEAKV